MNFTAILKTVNHFKMVLLLNSIIFYQAAHYWKQPLDNPLNHLLANIFGINKRALQTESSHTITEPIQDVASIMLLDNMKLYFLLIYSASIILFVVLLDRMHRKKKNKINKIVDHLDNNGDCFIEKIVFDRRGHPVKNSADEKEIMSCEVKAEILKKLLQFEEGTKYTDKHFNLSALSVKLKTNTKYLSYIINKYKKKDFNSYINELRILYIIKKMENNPAYLNYKISYLADECGFSSHSKFTAVFKSVVGMSPSRFMDMLTKRTK